METCGGRISAREIATLGEDPAGFYRCVASFPRMGKQIREPVFFGAPLAPHSLGDLPWLSCAVLTEEYSARDFGSIQVQSNHSEKAALG
jgi:hypothetical protein